MAAELGQPLIPHKVDRRMLTARRLAGLHFDDAHHRGHVTRGAGAHLRSLKSNSVQTTAGRAVHSKSSTTGSGTTGSSSQPMLATAGAAQAARQKQHPPGPL